MTLKTEFQECDMRKKSYNQDHNMLKKNKLLKENTQDVFARWKNR